METANTKIDYKNLESSFEMQVNTIKIRNKIKSKGKYGSKHRLPFTPKKVLKSDVPKIKEHLENSKFEIENLKENLKKLKKTKTDFESI